MLKQVRAARMMNQIAGLSKHAELEASRGYASLLALQRVETRHFGLLDAFRRSSAGKHPSIKVRVLWPFRCGAGEVGHSGSLGGSVDAGEAEDGGRADLGQLAWSKTCGQRASMLQSQVSVERGEMERIFRLDRGSVVSG